MPYNERILTGTGNATIDVCTILDTFKVTCPALQALVTKALCLSAQTPENATQDLADIYDDAYKAKELALARLQGKPSVTGATTEGEIDIGSGKYND